jgi:SnoaL-like domain
LTEALQDEFAIRKLIESWAVWRDSGDWVRLRSVWHEDGAMQATWFYGTADEFVARSSAAFDRGVEVLHTLNGISIDLRGNRAVAQTKMEIHQRAKVEEVLCDCVCIGRFYDLFEKRAGRWGMVLRHPIYEQDSLSPVDTTQTLMLDRGKLAKLPAGYRHLAYMQIQNGMSVKLDMPGTRGPEVDALYAQGKAWLAEALEA